MERWIRANPMAQMVGFLMREFRLKFEDFEDMTALQFLFLAAWSRWYASKSRPMSRPINMEGVSPK